MPEEFAHVDDSSAPAVKLLRFIDSIANWLGEHFPKRHDLPPSRQPFHEGAH